MNYFQVPSGCFFFPFFQWLGNFQPLWRPLDILSRLFSWIVPFTRWSGLTQAGLSQVCMTIGLLVSKPSVMCFIYLCARHCLPSKPNKPYPLLSVFAFQSQQSSVTATLEKNRSIGSVFLRPISKIYNKELEMSN